MHTKTSLTRLIIALEALKPVIWTWGVPGHKNVSNSLNNNPGGLKTRYSDSSYTNLHLTFLLQRSTATQNTPKYPIELARSGIKGCAVLSFNISESGKTENVEIIDSVPKKHIGKYSRKMLKKWRWVPATTVAESDSQTFSYTGAQQTFTVPSGVSTITIKAWGAQGGSDDGSNRGDGGLGGYAIGNLSVTAGNTLYIYVGGEGVYSSSHNSSGTSGGWNGGGRGGSGSGASGGGASDVRSGGTALSNRVIVAGGGGGFDAWNNDGGVGGGTTGGSGGGSATVATGGTQSAGGTGGSRSGYTGENGTLGDGGDNSNYAGGTYTYGGGGGGGYYGGGGGQPWCAGGGGSSYLGGVTSSSTTSGQRSGNGQIIITW